MLLRSLAMSSVLELPSITDVHTIFSNLNANRAETSRITVNRLLWVTGHIQCVCHTAPIGFVFLTRPARDPELAIWHILATVETVSLAVFVFPADLFSSSSLWTVHSIATQLGRRNGFLVPRLEGPLIPQICSKKTGILILIFTMSRYCLTAGASSLWYLSEFSYYFYLQKI